MGMEKWRERWRELNQMPNGDLPKGWVDGQIVFIEKLLSQQKEALRKRIEAVKTEALKLPMGADGGWNHVSHGYLKALEAFDRDGVDPNQPVYGTQEPF